MLVGLFSAIDLTSQEADAVLAPVVTIAFMPEEETQTADVRPGEHGTVTFPGTVRAELAAGGTVQNVVVTLQGSTSLNWPVTVNPATLTVAPGGDEVPFSVTVTVPPETSYIISDTLSVGGRAQPFPGAGLYTVQPITGTILVAQFYKFALACDKPYKQVNPTEELAFNLRIWNYGNGRDTFRLFIPKLDKLAGDGWNVQLSQYTLDVDEKSQQTVQVQNKTPVKFNHWINRVETIEIEVSSEQQASLEGTAFPKTYPFAVRQRGFSLPGFDPILVIISFAFIAIFAGRGHQIHLERNKRRSRVKLRSRPKRRIKKK
jgi:hypothetical protein